MRQGRGVWAHLRLMLRFSVDLCSSLRYAYSILRFLALMSRVACRGECSPLCFSLSAGKDSRKAANCSALGYVLAINRVFTVP